MAARTGQPPDHMWGRLPGLSELDCTQMRLIRPPLSRPWPVHRCIWLRWFKVGKQKVSESPVRMHQAACSLALHHLRMNAHEPRAEQRLKQVFKMTAALLVCTRG